ncbi:hypothetical protein NSND_60930 [Nitrospira sp. ND1]|nr:hypothetical protein NSND_60930 [Nitrospira sp. ND1]
MIVPTCRSEVNLPEDLVVKGLLGQGIPVRASNAECLGKWPE